MPPYFKQTRSATCSLAVFRMVLAARGINVQEQELIDQVAPDYGGNFSNIWNPTIARLAARYGLEVTMVADWPLLNPLILPMALAEFRELGPGMSVTKYENPNDTDHLPESLPLSYQEMFKAIELGCRTQYGPLSVQLIRETLEAGGLIQTSVRLKELYGTGKGYHSLLLYAYEDGTVEYHDPSRGPKLKVAMDKLARASLDVGAGLVYANALSLN